MSTNIDLICTECKQIYLFSMIVDVKLHQREKDGIYSVYFKTQIITCPTCGSDKQKFYVKTKTTK